LSKTTPRNDNKGLHPNNLHRHGYDFEQLVDSFPSLAEYVDRNEYGNKSIDFADPLAVKALNAALLSHYYHLNHWDIPQGALCPPIPGRVDYLHYMADLLGLSPANSNSTLNDSTIKMLDVGTGANGIYALLACQHFGWQCVASDINTQSLENVSEILTHNPLLQDRLTLRLQQDKNNIFTGIIEQGEQFDLTVCNPPFHRSLDEAMKGAKRKVSQLARSRGDNTHRGKASLNFGGTDDELWCKGGEQLFIKKMIKQSSDFSAQCRWFSTLVSKADNVKSAVKLIKKLGATDVRQIEMTQGNKITRVLAWTYR
jgi:23S rRNA (adenine1618-N6)-methyltransferase